MDQDEIVACLACPPGCPECSEDESDCECYTHQDDHPDEAAARLERMALGLDR
jgi:hypothetical protein